MNYWVWLATLEGIVPIKKKRLLEKFKSPKNIFYASKEQILNVEGMSEENYEYIEKKKDIQLITKYEAYLHQNKIQMVHIQEESYPDRLRMIYDPPMTLFCIGDISLLNNVSIGIVGSREPSHYGKMVAEHFSNELSKESITIVSGLAKGIDTCAHVGALKSNGKTIAVLGNGVDIVYPNENIKVYNEIAQKGLIISEYIVGSKPEAWHFPARNRIISALSQGVLVVEAKKQSGTMITTDFALEQGRELYVVPGNITSSNSEGTNNLIKEGAKVVTTPSDILEDLC